MAVCKRHVLSGAAVLAYISVLFCTFCHFCDEYADLPSSSEASCYVGLIVYTIMRFFAHLQKRLVFFRILLQLRREWGGGGGLLRADSENEALR